MTEFWKSDTYLIVKAMKATGNQPGVVAQWKSAVEAWTAKAVGSDIEAVKTWLPYWQVRPTYTAAELAPLFPMLSIALGFTSRPTSQKSPNRLANELKFAGLPYREIDGKTYFIVERCHHWRDAEEKEFRDALG